MTEQTISQDAFLGVEPVQGSLTGTFQDCLDYLDWAINVFAGKGNMSVEKKSKAFVDAVQTLHNRFGMKMSTHYLKQFCEKQKHKNLHIAYLLRLADYKTSPTKTSFKGAIVNGQRCVVPKIFDMLITKQEWEAKEEQAQAFKDKCISEWDARDKELEQQKLNLKKLEIVNSLEEQKVEPTLNELEELAPDLKTPDRDYKKF